MPLFSAKLAFGFKQVELTTSHERREAIMRIFEVMLSDLALEAVMERMHYMRTNRKPPNRGGRFEQIYGVTDAHLRCSTLMTALLQQCLLLIPLFMSQELRQTLEEPRSR